MQELKHHPLPPEAQMSFPPSPDASASLDTEQPQSAEIVDMATLKSPVPREKKEGLTSDNVDVDPNQALKQKLADFESMLNGHTLEAMQKYGQGAKSPEEIVLGMEAEIRRNEKNIRGDESPDSRRQKALRAEMASDLSHNNESSGLSGLEKMSPVDLAKGVDISGPLFRDLGKRQAEKMPTSQLWTRTKYALADSFIGSIWERLSRNYGFSPMKIWAQQKFFSDRYADKIGRLNQKLDILNQTSERLKNRLASTPKDSSNYFKFSRALAETQTRREIFQERLDSLQSKNRLAQAKINGVALKLKERVETRLAPVEEKLTVADKKCQEMKDSLAGLRSELSLSRVQVGDLKKALKDKNLHKVERQAIRGELAEARKNLDLLDKAVTWAESRLLILARRTDRSRLRVTRYRHKVNKYDRLIDLADGKKNSEYNYG